MTSLRIVSSTSGISASGMPNDSTTWLRISASVGLTPIASTTSAGTIVTARRSSTEMLRLMKPLITTCPAYVPTLDEDAPEANSATAKASAARPPTWLPKPW